MKKSNFNLWAMLAIVLILNFTACNEDDDYDYSSNNGSLTLTVGAKRQLEVTSFNTEGPITWTSSDEAVASVSSSGVVTALNFTNSSTGTGSAVITARSENNESQTFTITTTMTGQVDIMSLSPMKTQFSQYFMIGNIFNPGDVSGGASVTNTRLTRHYNILTAENNMKPQYISTGPGSNNFATADSMVNAARASGFLVVGHTLLWHSQNASWMNGSNANLANMKAYISSVVSHFSGSIYSWDVLNEVFPDGVSAGADWKTAMRSNNPWFANQGSSFVYEGFLAARQADPNAILYYNDYNLDQVGKATLVRNMVRDVNAQYAAANPGSRKLIEGIGMQSHHNTSVRAAAIKATLDLFRPLGVKIAISELDVLGQTYQQFSPSGQGTNKHGNSTVTYEGLLTQAGLYGEYFRVFLDNADIIERVTFWGVTDNQSWRSAGLPLLFDSNGKAKPSYYKAIGARDQ